MAIKSGGVLAFSKTPETAESRSIDVPHNVYRQAGVDTAEADAGLSHIVARVQRTWPKDGAGQVLLPIGYFANVIQMNGIGLALCTDGVGSKTIVAAMNP